MCGKCGAAGTLALCALHSGKVGIHFSQALFIILIHMMYGFGSMGFGSLFGVIFWVLLLTNMVLLAVWLFKKIGKE